MLLQMTKSQPHLIPSHLSGMPQVADRSPHTFLEKLSDMS
jgi:hypothetical protein